MLQWRHFMDICADFRRNPITYEHQTSSHHPPNIIKQECNYQNITRFIIKLAGKFTNVRYGKKIKPISISININTCLSILQILESTPNSRNDYTNVIRINIQDQLLKKIDETKSLCFNEKSPN